MSNIATEETPGEKYRRVMKYYRDTYGNSYGDSIAGHTGSCGYIAAFFERRMSQEDSEEFEMRYLTAGMECSYAAHKMLEAVDRLEKRLNELSRL